MPHHDARRSAELPAQHGQRLSVGAAILTLAALSNAATTAPAMQQVQPAFGATSTTTSTTTERVAPKLLAPPPPPPSLASAPAGLARPATAAEPKRAHAALPSVSNSLGERTLDTPATQSAKKLFDMDDRAIIIVSGRQTTAGEVKKSVLAELAKKDGPPRTVKGAARNLDLAALSVRHAATAAMPTLSARTLNAPLDPSTQVNITPVPSTRGTFAESSQRRGALLKELRCDDKGPPAIGEIKGKLKAGGSAFTIEGRCFGDRSARVVVYGKFGTIDYAQMEAMTGRL
ncbi:MAG: hypothetical protein V4792_10955, partial [Pseudomonadota bacterium]